jgi:hypothetical protein
MSPVARQHTGDREHLITTVNRPTIPAFRAAHRAPPQADYFERYLVIVPMSAVVRVYRPGPPFWYWLSIRYARFSVIIDGIDRGEVWARQTKALDVRPGEHEVRVKRGRLITSNIIKVTVDSTKTVDVACSIRGELVGWPELQLATQKQRDRMQKVVTITPTP